MTLTREQMDAAIRAASGALDDQVWDIERVAFIAGLRMAATIAMRTTINFRGDVANAIRAAADRLEQEQQS